jgi:hypothetical protein
VEVYREGGLVVLLVVEIREGDFLGAVLKLGGEAASAGVSLSLAIAGDPSIDATDFHASLIIKGQWQ